MLFAILAQIESNTVAFIDLRTLAKAAEVDAPEAFFLPCNACAILIPNAYKYQGVCTGTFFSNYLPGIL